VSSATWSTLRYECMRNLRGRRKDAGGLSRDRQQRLDRVREYVLVHGSVTSAELAERFDVSIMTVHRDPPSLSSKDCRGSGRRYVAASAVFESDVGYRLKAMQAEKDRSLVHARVL